MHITNASPSRICLVLLSHLGEPISLRKLTDEVYDNAPKGRRDMNDRVRLDKFGKPDNSKEAIASYDRANYEEVRQCCNDLEAAGVINKPDPNERVGRESLISLHLRAFISEVFKAKNVDKKKVDWEGLIALMERELKEMKKVNTLSQENIAEEQRKLKRLQKDAKEARTLRATSATSLNQREISFLIKRIDTDRLRELCDSLRKSGILDYIRGESNIVNLFIALIKGDGINVDDGFIVDDWTTLELLGLKGIDTNPITDTIIQSFVWRSGYPEVIEFHNRYYVSRPLD